LGAIAAVTRTDRSFRAEKSPHKSKARGVRSDRMFG
jgi:hypothetical protein